MSGQAAEQFREFLNQLQSDENRPVALNDIKNLILFKPTVEAVNTIRNVGISKIVQCLNVQEKTHVDLTCEVLKICFDKFEAGDLIKYYTTHIMYLLRHKQDCVRRLAIDEVYKTVVTDINLLPMPQYIDIYVAVAQLVADSDIGVANKAILITSNLPQEVYPKVLDEMRIALEYNSSSKCNAFEVIINISSKSYELFKLSADLNYIDYMISELQSNDVLYELNVLDLLSRLAVKPYGINYLIKQGGLKKIADMIAESRNNPLGGLLMPGFMKFFGCVAYHYPKEIFDKYPVLLNSVFEAIESGDQSTLPVAFDTLGYIGTTIEGKLCLAAQGGKYTQSIEKLGHIIRDSPTNIKIRAFYCLANLINIDKDPGPKTAPVDHRITLMTREWYRCLTFNTSSMHNLLDYCKNPFPDLSLAAFTLLDAVCQHQWGQEEVARTPGAIEYILDNIVSTKEIKEVKYDIVKRLSNSAAFDSNTIMRLQMYVERGPFFSESTTEVAMEGD